MRSAIRVRSCSAYRAADLQQQVIMRVVAHRAVEELGGAAGARPHLEEHRLVHVVAREAVGGGDEHAAPYGVPQAVEPRARQHGAAVAVVAEHTARVERPALGGELLELLLNGLVLDLVAGRDAAVDRYAHGAPPAGSGAPASLPTPARSSPPTAATCASRRTACAGQPGARSGLTR